MTDQPTQTWQDQTLKLSGMSLLVGDAAMFTAGVLKSFGPGKQPGALGEAAAGALWGLGGLTTACFGNPDKEMQLRILAHKLENYLKDHGARVTDGMRDKTALLHGQSGVLHTVERFMHEYPSEIMNTLFAVGAGSLLYKGAVGKNINSTMMGALVMAGALGGLLIKEDPEARKKAENGNIFQKAVAYVQEKPLRLSSSMYMANDYFTFRNALADRKTFEQIERGFKPHYFSFITATTYIFANIFMFMSPRNQIEDRKFNAKDIEQLEEVAAEIIGAQPKEAQRLMLLHVSDYLAQEKGIPISASHLAEKLEIRIDEVTNRRISEAAERGWRNRHEAMKHAQANKEHAV